MVCKRNNWTIYIDVCVVTYGGVLVGSRSWNSDSSITVDFKVQDAVAIGESSLILLTLICLSVLQGLEQQVRLQQVRLPSSTQTPYR